MISFWVPENYLDVVKLCNYNLNLLTDEHSSTSQISHLSHTSAIREHIYHDLVDNIHARYFENRLLLIFSRLLVNLLEYGLERWLDNSFLLWVSEETGLRIAYIVDLPDAWVPYDKTVRLYPKTKVFSYWSIPVSMWELF